MTRPVSAEMPELSRAARAAEMLDAETERALAIRWRDHRDHAALSRLVTAHLRLAIAIAARYRRHGASMGDLIQEANLGLMKAAEKFDPDRGVRFSTYAMLWIRSQIQDHVMRTWSVVRTGSTSAQKSLFFNLSRVRARVERARVGAGQPIDGAEIRREIADELGVPLRDVETMEGRLGGADLSLDAPQADEGGRAWVETIADDGVSSADVVSDRLDTLTARSWLLEAFGALSDRERSIIAARKLDAEPQTLESLGRRFGVSKERIRQLEDQALRKMRAHLSATHGRAAQDLVGV